MLFHLLYPLHETLPFLNVVRYPTFRVIMAVLTALGLTFFLYPWFIRRLQSMQIGQTVRSDGPESHKKKTGTPTMGGSLVLFAVVVPTLLWSDLRNPLVWVALTVTVGFGIVGFIDDYRKIREKNSRGLSGRLRLLAEFAIAGGAGVALVTASDFDTRLFLPFLKESIFSPNLAYAYVPFAMFVVVGSSNAVNLTDGLDGLAIGPVIICALTFVLLAYGAGTVLTDKGEWLFPATFNIADYLKIPHIKGASELSIFCASVAGAGIGFLWYNTYPAQVFMGDVGSLSLGAALGIVAVVTKNEFLLVILGGVFVAEAFSVILQVGFYKWKKRRILLMAPLHHHFELKGWAEPKIIVRAWIVSIILALVALASLKLR